MIGLRRYAARILAWLAVEVDPDPALTFTTTSVRRIDQDANYELTKQVADAIGGLIVGRGVTGRKFTPGEGKTYEY